MVAMLIKLLFARDFARTLKLLHVEMSQQWAKTGHDLLQDDHVQSKCSDERCDYL